MMLESFVLVLSLGVSVGLNVDTISGSFCCLLIFVWVIFLGNSGLCDFSSIFPPLANCCTIIGLRRVVVSWFPFGTLEKCCDRKGLWSSSVACSSLTIFLLCDSFCGTLVVDSNEGDHCSLLLEDDF